MSFKTLPTTSIPHPSSQFMLQAILQLDKDTLKMWLATRVCFFRAATCMQCVSPKISELLPRLIVKHSNEPLAQASVSAVVIRLRLQHSEKQEVCTKADQHRGCWMQVATAQIQLHRTSALCCLGSAHSVTNKFSEYICSSVALLCGLGLHMFYALGLHSRSLGPCVRISHCSRAEAIIGEAQRNTCKTKKLSKYCMPCALIRKSINAVRTRNVGG